MNPFLEHKSLCNGGQMAKGANFENSDFKKQRAPFKVYSFSMNHAGSGLRYVDS